MRSGSPVPASFNALALALPPIAALAPKGVVPLLLIAALPALVSAWRTGWRPRPDPVLAGLVLAWMVWALIASAWTFEPWDAWIMWLRDGALLVLAVLLHDVARTRLDPAARARLGRYLAAGAVLGSLAIAQALLTDHALVRLVTGVPEGAVPRGDSRLNRGATTLLLVLPAALLAMGSANRVAAAGLAGAGVAAILATPSGTALVAVIAALGTSALALWRSGAARAVLGAAIVAAVAGMPWIADGLAKMPENLRNRLPESAQHRLHIWDFTVRRIAERPLWGWGFNSAEAMPNFGTTPFYPDQSRVIPLHPHNGPLQVRLDLGLPGVAIGLGFALAPLMRMGRASPPGRAAVHLATLAAALTIAALAYGIWQEQWLATLAAVAVLLAGTTDPPPRASDRTACRASATSAAPRRAVQFALYPDRSDQHSKN